MASMESNYEVQFEDCKGYKTGDIVPGSLLADTEAGLDYLLRVGAVTATDGEQLIKAASASVQGQIDIATASLREELLSKDSELMAKDQEIAQLTKDKEDLLLQIDVLKAKGT